jgi:hypothetical protein
MRRVRATTVAVENQSVTCYKRVFVALNTHRQMRMPHTVILWPLWLYCIFLHYLINGMTLENKLMNTKCVF